MSLVCKDGYSGPVAKCCPECFAEAMIMPLAQHQGPLSGLETIPQWFTVACEHAEGDFTVIRILKIVHVSLGCSGFFKISYQIEAISCSLLPVPTH